MGPLINFSWSDFFQKVCAEMPDMNFKYITSIIFELFTEIIKGKE